MHAACSAAQLTPDQAWAKPSPRCVLSKRKASLLLPKELHHAFADIGTIQASLRFASTGLLLILLRDCKAGKENRTEHASTSRARGTAMRLA